MKMATTRTIVLAMVLLLQLSTRRGVVVDAKPLKEMHPLPKDGTKLSQLPSRNCPNCDAILENSAAIEDNSEFGVRSKKSNALVQNEEKDSNVIKQVIFIEPPEYVYNHAINVQSEGKMARTVIYVFPPKVKHVYNITDKRTLSEFMEEPKVYYLGATKHSGDGNTVEAEESRISEDEVENFQTVTNNEQNGNSYKTQPKRPSSQTRLFNALDESNRRQKLEISKIPETFEISKNPKLLKENVHLNPSVSLQINNELQSDFTTTEEPKYYRRFNYFSPKDYEELMASRRREQLLEQSQTQYHTNYAEATMSSTISAITEVPAPDLSKMKPQQFEDTTTPSYNDFPKLKNLSPVLPAPVVNLQYEEDSYSLPIRNYHSSDKEVTSQHLSPPPVQQHGEFQWGSKNTEDAGYRTIMTTPDNIGKNIRKIWSDQIKHAPTDDSIEDSMTSGSEWNVDSRQNYDFFPAFFRNYFYAGPNHSQT